MLILVDTGDFMNGIFQLKMVRYGLIAIFVMVCDLIISQLFFNQFMGNGVLAHMVGSVCGFLMQYKLSFRWVYDSKESYRNFILFFLSFVLGLAVSSCLFSLNFYYYNIPLLFSRMIAIVLTFFVNYYLRLYLFDHDKLKILFEDDF